MITYEQLKKANETLNTTNIKGKEYAEVNQRIKAFRMVYPNGAIITDMLSNENGVCVFKATIYNEDQIIIGTGTAYEKETSSFINKTSYIENCETSAVGRALGMCGFGIDTSVASAEEVQNAINNQNKTEERPMLPRARLIKKLNEMKMDVEKYAKEKGLNKQTTDDRYEELLEELEVAERFEAIKAQGEGKCAN